MGAECWRLEPDGVGTCARFACDVPGLECQALEACVASTENTYCVPTCGTDADCPTAQTCFSGYCARPCTTDVECRRGEHCSALSICERPPEAPDAGLDTDRDADLDADREADLDADLDGDVDAEVPDAG